MLYKEMSPKVIQVLAESSNAVECLLFCFESGRLLDTVTDFYFYRLCVRSSKVWEPACQSDYCWKLLQMRQTLTSGEDEAMSSKVPRQERDWPSTSSVMLFNTAFTTCCTVFAVRVKSESGQWFIWALMCTPPWSLSKRYCFQDSKSIKSRYRHFCMASKASVCAVPLLW